MNKPTIFIGSSSEGLDIAKAIEKNLQDTGDIKVWTQGVFELGNSYLESLINELDKADFAILVLTGDDITKSRNKKTVSPRDNVLFELGLFMGRLGKKRSFFIYDKENKQIKIPSDLSGIKGAEYKLQQSGTLASSLGPACNVIQAAVNKEGVRAKINMDIYTKRLKFCDNITGYWWERITPDTGAALSFVGIEYDEDLLILKITGRTFDNKGNYNARWETKSTGIHFEEQIVVYNWKGWFISKPSEIFEGVGEISFSGKEETITEGSGIFSNINTTDISSIEKSSFELNKSNEAEVKIMNSKDKKKIAKLIVDKIGKMF